MLSTSDKKLLERAFGAHLTPLESVDPDTGEVDSHRSDFGGACAAGSLVHDGAVERMGAALCVAEYVLLILQTAVIQSLLHKSKHASRKGVFACETPASRRQTWPSRGVAQTQTGFVQQALQVHPIVFFHHHSHGIDASAAAIAQRGEGDARPAPRRSPQLSCYPGGTASR